jgi:8-oxo-dGTP diphosphatase
VKYRSVVNQVRAALKAPLPGAAAHDMLAPRPRRAWPQNVAPAALRHAAGLLLLFPIDARAHLVLTVRGDSLGRHGGQVSLPGGAIEPGESIEEAALREAHEEAGLDAGQVTTGELVVVDHGPWSYTYVLAGTATRTHLEPSDLETEDLAWVPVAEVAGYPLHPLFEEAWPGLRDLVTGPVSRS